MDEQTIVEKFNLFICSGMSYATSSHKLILGKETNIPIALSYLNAAISCFSSAEALYYAKYEMLQNEESDRVFFYFKKYADELLRNASTNHSHQWTDIEFERLNDFFKTSIFSSKDF